MYCKAAKILEICGPLIRGTKDSKHSYQWFNTNRRRSLVSFKPHQCNHRCKHMNMYEKYEHHGFAMISQGTKFYTRCLLQSIDHNDHNMIH